VEALLRFPDHPASLAVAAEIAARKGMLDMACRLAEKSFSIYPDFAVAAALVDYREAMGDAQGAARAKATVRTLEALFSPEEKRVHRLLALYEADHGDAARAVAMTARELETRKDLLGYDAYAWSLHRAGRAKEAVEPMKKALARGTIDPLLEFHAGAIAKAAGDESEAKKHLEKALKIDPRFHVKYAKEAKDMLAAGSVTK
jgi:tetratricopeptide (TPR) repeat protein